MCRLLLHSWPCWSYSPPTCNPIIILWQLQQIWTWNSTSREVFNIFDMSFNVTKEEKPTSCDLPALTRKVGGPAIWGQDLQGQICSSLCDLKGIWKWGAECWGTVNPATSLVYHGAAGFTAFQYGREGGRGSTSLRIQWPLPSWSRCTEAHCSSTSEHGWRRWIPPLSPQGSSQHYALW